MVDDPKAVLNGVGREAADFVFQNYKKLALYAAAFSLIDMIFWWLLPAGTLSAVIQYMLWAYLYTVFAIMIHRWILLDEVMFRAGADKRVLFFFVMLVVEVNMNNFVIGVFWAPFALIKSDAINMSIVWALVGVALLAAGMGVLWLVARLTTVFPNLVVVKSEKLSLNAIILGYRLSKGAAWEIIKRLVVFWLLGRLLRSVLGFLQPYDEEQSAAGLAQEVVWSLFDYLHTWLAFALLPFFVALASFIYRRLVDDLQRKREGAQVA